SASWTASRRAASWAARTTAPPTGSRRDDPRHPQAAPPHGRRHRTDAAARRHASLAGDPRGAAHPRASVAGARDGAGGPRDLRVRGLPHRRAGPRRAQPVLAGGPMITLPAPARTGRPVGPPPAKAGPLGPGAGPLMTEWLLPTVLGTDDQKRMAKALKLGVSVKWVRSAERIIASKIAGCEWHLEDPDGETIDDEWKGPDLALVTLARDLMDDPQGELPLSGDGSVGMRLSRR